MFDNAPQRKSDRVHEPEDRAERTEDARIALRCDRRELRALDSFVHQGEFASRSELMRAALHAFLKSRAASSLPTPAVDAEGLVEVPVRLRPEELAALETFCRTVGTGRPVKDLLAEMIRRAEMEMKVVEMVQRTRANLRDAAETRTQVGALQESAKDLERKGVVGR